MDNIKDLLNLFDIPGDPIDAKALAADEYIKDNEIHCKKCNTPRTERVWKAHRRISCECQREAKRIYEATPEYQRMLAEQKKEAERRIVQDKQSSLHAKKAKAGITLRYRDVSFVNTTSSDKTYMQVRERCTAYVTDLKAHKKGIGLYLYGEKGTGKTRLSACIANALIEEEKSVIFTSFGEIDRHIKDTFNSNESERVYIEKLEKVEYLFIDDFGTEKVVTIDGRDRMLQEKIYDIVNSRYNALKPTLYTSNNSPKELWNKGVASKTLDRIMEVSEFLKLDGESKRREIFVRRQS